MRVTSASGLLALLLCSATAHAAESELIVAIEPGYGVLHDDPSMHGIGADVSLWFGLTETFWLSGSAGARSFFAEGDNRVLFEGAGGIVAALDVLRTIPFAELMLELVASDDGAAIPTFRVGAGADFLVTKSFGLGGVIRWRPLTDEIASDGLLTVQLRVSWRFEL